MPENHVLRVHWGYYMMYAQQPFHHEDYCWDGGVFVTGGRVVRCSLLRLHGPATPSWEKQIPLDRPFWHWHADSARYRFGGVLFEVEGGPGGGRGGAHQGRHAALQHRRDHGQQADQPARRVPLQQCRPHGHARWA